MNKLRIADALYGAAWNSDLSGWGEHRSDHSGVHYYLDCGCGIRVTAEVDVDYRRPHPRFKIESYGFPYLELHDPVVSVGPDLDMMLTGRSYSCEISSEDRSDEDDDDKPEQKKNRVPLESDDELSVEGDFFRDPTVGYAGVADADEGRSAINLPEMDRLTRLLYTDDRSDLMAKRTEYQIADWTFLTLAPEPTTEFSSNYPCTLEYRPAGSCVSIELKGILLKNSYSGLTIICPDTEVEFGFTCTEAMIAHEKKLSSQVREYLALQTVKDYSYLIRDP